MELPVSPFVRLKSIPVVDREALTRRVPCFAGQKIMLSKVVNDSISWHLVATDVSQGGKEVSNVHNFIMHGARLNFSGPADKKRSAKGAFQRREVRTSPGTCGSVVRKNLFWPVLTHP